MVKIIKLETGIEDEIRKKGDRGYGLCVVFLLESKTDIALLKELLWCICESTFTEGYSMKSEYLHMICELDFNYNDDIVNILTIENYVAAPTINWNLEKVKFIDYLFYDSYKEF